jgi:hypothetical protein
VPGDVVQRRVPGAGRTGDRSPRASALLLVRRAPVARAAPVRDPGTRASLAGTGRTCCSPRGRIRSTGRRRRTRLRLPGGSARCTGSRRWVEARTVVRRSRSATGAQVVPAGRRRTRLRLPGGSARCTGQSAVGRGENRRASKSVGGRSAPSEVSQRRPMSAGRGRMGSGTESSVAVTRGRGRPVSACSGPCGG